MFSISSAVPTVRPILRPAQCNWRTAVSCQKEVAVEARSRPVGTKLKPAVLASKFADVVRLRYNKLAKDTAVSVPDEAFACKGLRFVETDTDLSSKELWSLFEKVNFASYPPVHLQGFIDDTAFLVWARPLFWPPGLTVPVLAAAFAMTDGHRQATIWNVCVDPGWQLQGLGRAVVERLLLQMVANPGWLDVTVLATPEHQAFYEKLGFVEDPDADIVI